MWYHGKSLSLSSFFSVWTATFSSRARGTLSSITGKIATPRRRFRVRSAKYPFVRRALRCNSRRLEIISYSPLLSSPLLPCCFSVSPGDAFINFTAASPKNNIVERERNTDSPSLNRGSLIFHSRESAFPSLRYIGEGVIAAFFLFGLRRCVFCVSVSRRSIDDHLARAWRDLLTDSNLCLELTFHIYDPLLFMHRAWRIEGICAFFFFFFYRHNQFSIVRRNVYEIVSLKFILLSTACHYLPYSNPIYFHIINISVSWLRYHLLQRKIINQNSLVLDRYIYVLIMIIIMSRGIYLNDYCWTRLISSLR